MVPSWESVSVEVGGRAAAGAAGPFSGSVPPEPEHQDDALKQAIEAA